MADFYIRYPDEVYLAQVSKMVDDAARAAALATGTKVKIDHYGEDRDGIGVGSLNEVAFAYMKKFGATGVVARARQAAGLRGDGQRVERDSRASGSAPRRRTRRITPTRWSRTRSAPVGHSGFVVDAQAMAALLFDFATRADYRAVVKREFETIRGAARRVRRGAREDVRGAEGAGAVRRSTRASS